MRSFFSQVTVRSLVIGIACVALTNAAMLRTELVTGNYIASGVPPMPAITVLLALVAFNPLLGKLHPRLRLRRSEILVVYAFLIVSVSMSTFGVTRAFFPCLTVPFYFNTPQNRFDELSKYVPRWYVPQDREIIRQEYEGMDVPVPWAVWLKPLLIWGVFFLVLFLTLLCLMSLLRRAWVEWERLPFPLLHLPLSLTSDHSPLTTHPSPSFFRNPVMWCGVSVAAVHNLLNILHAFNPAVPCLGFYYDIGQIFTEEPWTALRPFYVHYALEILGFAYLVSMDISFSLWFFYLLLKLVNVFLRVVGYQPPGAPFYQEQAAGGMVAMGLILLWTARKHWWFVVRHAVKRSAVGDGGTPFHCAPDYKLRWALFGFLGGVVFLGAWCHISGMSLKIGAMYFGFILLFALVTARMRAEAGLPVVWLHPYNYEKTMILNALGSQGIVDIGGWQSLTLLSTLSFLSRHYFAHISAQNQMDLLKLSDEAHVRRRHLMVVMVFAMLFGLACGYWVHLTAYYRYGQNLVEGGLGQGDYRTTVALQEYTTLSGFLTTPRPPDVTRTTFTGIGFFIVIALTVLRTFFLRFPLHPLGFLLGTLYGPVTPYWGPFLIAWLCRRVALWLGGAKLYRQLIPAFLGLAIGHFFIAGIVWGTMAQFIPEEVFRRYRLYFGG